MPKHKFSLVACARWEENDILEWLDYHCSVGIDHVYLYSNDDNASTLKNAIGPHLEGACPFVTYRHWHPSKGGQSHMYAHFLTHHRFETEWLCFLDIDEFLVIKGHNDLPRFMAPLEPHFDAVYFNWVIYGANGRRTRQPGSVLMGLTRRNRRMDFHTKNFIRARFADPKRIPDYALSSANLRHGINLATSMRYLITHKPQPVSGAGRAWVRSARRPSTSAGSSRPNRIAG